jgi:hypothetical protein
VSKSVKVFQRFKAYNGSSHIFYKTISIIKRDNVKRNANFHEYKTSKENGRHVNVHRTELYKRKKNKLEKKGQEVTDIL